MFVPIRRFGTGAMNFDALPAGHYAKSLKPSRVHGWGIIRCPSCQRLSTIGRNHDVGADGIVTPSYGCPFSPCTWHVFIRLVDWSAKSC